MRKTNCLTIFLVASISHICSSCHFNSTFINREEDENEAEKITNRFYHLIKTNEYSKTYPLFSNAFFTVTDTVKLNNMFLTTYEKLGPIEALTVSKWETRVIQGTDSKSEYVLQYFVKRKNFDSKETITLTKENEQIKILGYKVNSDGFVTPERK